MKANATATAFALANHISDLTTAAEVLVAAVQVACSAPSPATVRPLAHAAQALDNILRRGV